MASETTFLCYSRVDSAFVLKLAKDLRNAGFIIFLDQLDIRAGVRWDNAIQSALSDSRIVIVILSSSSVASENVMDEVSFAIGNKKNLIPVLLNECIIPFRLSRFQRIDFTGDYQEGINYLIETLDYHAASKKLETGSTQQEKEQVRTSTLETKAVKEQQQQVETDNKLWDEAVKINSISSYIKYIGESVTSVHIQKARQLINKLEIERKNKESEEQLWENTVTENTFDAYKHYLNEYVDGNYKQDALAAIGNIEEIEKKKQELLAENERALIADQENGLWEEVATENTILSYEKYLHKTKIGLFKEKAQQLINKLKAQQKEKELETLFWQKVKAEHTVSSYKEYLQHHPDGMYGEEASDAIKQMEDVKPRGINRKGSSKNYFLVLGSIVLFGVIMLVVLKFNTPDTEKGEIGKQMDSAGLVSQTKANSTNKKIQAPHFDSSGGKVEIAEFTPPKIVTDEEAKVNKVGGTDNSKTSIPKEKKASAPLKTINPNSPYQIGQKYGGGIIFYIDKTGQHGLIAAEHDLGKFTLDEAKQKCEDLGDGWHLPNQYELNKLYLKRKVVRGFASDNYWSSSEDKGAFYDKWSQGFDDGYQLRVSQYTSCYVRPVRAF